MAEKKLYSITLNFKGRKPNYTALKEAFDTAVKLVSLCAELLGRLEHENPREMGGSFAKKGSQK